MPRFESDNDARRLGEALADLRRERGLSQAEAGGRAGMTSQGWGLYESGKRSGLFRPDVQRRLTAALDTTPEALALRLRPTPFVAAPVTTGLEARGRDFDRAPPAPHRLTLSNDDLEPWAVSGVVLEYEVGRWPRRDQGCVVETQDGRTLVRIYEGADETTLLLRLARPGGEERLDRTRVRRVSAVTARLER